jgi:hypothetical protein
MSAVLFIVAWNEPALYQYVKASFARVDSVVVILDRRRKDRRRQPDPVPLERRQTERRVRNVSRSLKAHGWAIVSDAIVVPVARPSRGTETS